MADTAVAEQATTPEAPASPEAGGGETKSALASAISSIPSFTDDFATSTPAATDESDKGAGSQPNEDPKASEESAKEPKPVVLTPRQKSGNRFAKFTSEQLSALTPEQLALLDELGATWDRATGAIGAVAVKARKDAAGKAAEVPADDDKSSETPAEGEDPAAGKSAKEAASAPVVDAEVSFKPEDLVNEFGDVDATKQAAAFSRQAAAHNATRQEVKVLGARQEELIETMEDLVADQIFAALDPDAYSHLGSGPSWELEEDSGELAGRLELKDLARKIAIGAAVGEGKPISFATALRRAIGASGADKIRASERRKVADLHGKTQDKALHEPGRGSHKPKTDAERSRENLTRALSRIPVTEA